MPTKTCNPSGMGWEQFTAEGSELAQLKVWSGLTIRQKLEALDEMCEFGRHAIAQRQRQGLPYIDPQTGEVVQTAL